jgi:long-chain acyl-CoA synthetase
VEKIWLKQYPEGVQADVDLSGVPNLVHLIEKSFTDFGGRTHSMFMGRAISYRSIDEASAAFGAWLQSLGLPKGARVAIMMPNLPQYVVALCGILRAGYVVVNVNPMYTPRELEHQLTDAGASALVVLENFAKTAAEVISKTQVKHVVVASVGDMLGFPKRLIVNYVVRSVKKSVPEFDIPGAVAFNDAIAQGKGRALSRPEIAPTDLAFLQYTGGTTGVAKGAMLQHRHVVANVLISEEWLKPALRKRPIAEDQVALVIALPMYHIFSLVTCVWLGMRMGAKALLIADARDFDALVKTLAAQPFHFFPAVNTLFNSLANHAGFQTLDFSALRISNGGGAQVQRAVAEKWLALTKCPIAEGYGLTETCSGVTCNRADTEHYTGTIGVPMPSTDIAILDDDGKPVTRGEPGEIAIRGPQVMAGYWQRPDETAKVMTHDGYFKSGDVGVMDENGYITIVDRKKDMILVSGFNVYPNEIEGVVAGHPGVLECAAVGVPDENSGEAVKLVVVKKDPALTEKDLAAFCKENLTGYKRPKTIIFKDALPKTNVGKILRRELRDVK